MTEKRLVAVLTGSLRRESFSEKMGRELRRLAPDHLTLSDVLIGDLPFYNQDLETASPPDSWVRFRDEIKSCDAVLFVTPEYNRSIPAALKNAVDVGSRPYGDGVWAKPAAIASLSMGGLGGFAANHHLRQSVGALGCRIMPTPEFYVGIIQNLIDEQGRFNVEQTQQLARTFMDGFARWIEAVRLL